MLASSGYIAAVDEQLCIACETCKEYCQFEALSLSDWAMVVDWDQCMGCGVCVDKCDQGAISLRREPAKGVPLELRELLQGLPLVE